MSRHRAPNRDSLDAALKLARIEGDAQRALLESLTKAQLDAEHAYAEARRVSDEVTRRRAELDERERTAEPKERLVSEAQRAGSFRARLERERKAALEVVEKARAQLEDARRERDAAMEAVSMTAAKVKGLMARKRAREDETQKKGDERREEEALDSLVATRNTRTTKL